MKRGISSHSFGKKTIARDLSLGLICTIVLVTFSFAIANYIVTSRQTHETLVQEAETLSDHLAIVLATPLWSVDETAIQLIAEAYLQNDLVSGIHISDDVSGTVFKKASDEPSINLILVSKPIIFEEQQIGRVELSLTTQMITEARQNSLRTTLGGLLLLILAVVLMTELLLYGLLTRPLSYVTHGVENIAAGHYDQELKTTGLADLDPIIDKVNMMALQISERDSQLRDLVETLEQRVSELKQIETALQKSEERYRDLFENANDIIYTHDLQGNYTSVNNAAEQLLGLPASEILKLNFRDFLTDSDLERALIFMGEETDQHQNTVHELNLKTIDGREIILEVNARYVYEDGVRVEVQGIARGITERKLAEKQLASYLVELERSNQELQEFAYIASHDLQEPLRKIIAFGDRLQQRYKESIDEQGLDYINRMQNAAYRMRTLINDLLTLSRITTKAEPFEPVDLTAVVQNVLSDMEVHIKEKSAIIEVDPLPTIDGEPTQMRQLFQNLISNSLKFQIEKVTPHVKIKTHTPPETNHDFVHISLSDNSIGFDQQYAEQIFGMFQRLHGRGEYEGTGVGLAICRKITDRHGGKITAESQLNEGVTFHIALPIQQQTPNN